MPDAPATAALGARLAALLQPGDALFLIGGLGAGKTTLARGLIEAWTGEDEAPSPTFTLVQTYEGPKGLVWHADLYRLEDPEEVFELGLEEALGEALLIIEWPERLLGWVPVDRLELRLEPHAGGRIARLSGFGRCARFQL
ncbi:MAG: tRNA (adenosine(37)-N6)-threonylcarbamoyltransferase complex ATPase subunit type 1 TsaE [Hyphomonadaceae bacterium]